MAKRRVEGEARPNTDALPELLYARPLPLPLAHVADVAAQAVVAAGRSQKRVGDE